MAQPIFKWVGGKRRLIKEVAAHLPKKIDTYYEPMLGGGAVYFYLHECGRFKNAVISDINRDLMTTYMVVKNSVKKLINKLFVLNEEFHATDDMRDHFYKVRESEPQSQVEVAARMLYLNHTCFNGLYRVNKSGKFNAPFGKYHKYNILDEKRLIAAHHALQKAEIVCASYEDVLIHMGKNDATYIDPPYLPVDDTSFTTYTPGGFNYEDHEKLSKVMKRLRRNNLWAVLSNSDSEASWDLYNGFHIDKVFAPRSINSDGKGRGQVGELLINTRIK